MVRPILDRIFVEVEEPKQGAIITLEDDSEVKIGKVVAKGCDVRNVRVGDKVLFGKWSGTEVKLNGEERLILKEADILGVVEE